ncbi:MAG: succinate dehydrogenase, hydrophobic membrane anchor protein [Gammaproteobacteria bacterium AqS3]|nr:succinate dehydrogenase, hydrophobic membrane anchor protein [Gammaproteobacteria bacterium AqS3]
MLRSGTFWWLVQRVTSVLLLIVFGYTGVWWLGLDGGLTYAEFSGFLQRPLTRILGLTTGLAILLHSIYGIWNIVGDYMNAHTAGPVLAKFRPLAMGLGALLCLTYLLWMSWLFWPV